MILASHEVGSGFGNMLMVAAVVLGLALAGVFFFLRSETRAMRRKSKEPDAEEKT